LSEPVKKSVGSVCPVDKSSGHIDQNGIHSYHFKEECPAFITQDINNVIEQGQQKQADSSYIQYKRTGPQIFIDREKSNPL